MSIKNKVFICILLLVCLACLIVFNLSKYFNSEKYEIECAYNIEINKDTTKNLNVSDILQLAIENYVSFDKLALSDNFKNKYKSGNDIIPNKRQYSLISMGYMEEDGKDIIVVFADKKESIIDKIKGNEPITTEFHFEYKLNDEGLLDDLMLVDSYDTYSINGERVEAK